MRKNILKLTLMSMFAAISIILVFFIRFPIFPTVPFLEYDPADIPIFICTFLLGPLSGFTVTLVACIIQGITVSSAAGIIGISMHIMATGSYVLVAGNIYKRKKTIPNLIFASVMGIITMTISMALWNLILTPIFMGVPFNVVKNMILPIFIPFNLIKAGANSIVAFMLYKIISIFEKKINTLK